VAGIAKFFLKMVTSPAAKASADIACCIFRLLTTTMTYIPELMNNSGYELIAPKVLDIMIFYPYDARVISAGAEALETFEVKPELSWDHYEIMCTTLRDESPNNPATPRLRSWMRRGLKTIHTLVDAAIIPEDEETPLSTIRDMETVDEKDQKSKQSMSRSTIEPHESEEEELESDAESESDTSFSSAHSVESPCNMAMDVLEKSKNQPRIMGTFPLDPHFGDLMLPTLRSFLGPLSVISKVSCNSQVLNNESVRLNVRLKPVKAEGRFKQRFDERLEQVKAKNGLFASSVVADIVRTQGTQDLEPPPDGLNVTIKLPDINEKRRR